MGSKSKFGDQYGVFKCGQEKHQIRGGHVSSWTLKSEHYSHYSQKILIDGKKDMAWGWMKRKNNSYLALAVGKWPLVQVFI